MNKGADKIKTSTTKENQLNARTELVHWDQIKTLSV